MKLTEQRYNKYALVREMMETPEIIKSFKPEAAARFAEAVRKHKGLFLTGEGSSRIFPAKRAIYASHKKGLTLPVVTEGCIPQPEYILPLLSEEKNLFYGMQQLLFWQEKSCCFLLR